MSWTTTDLLNSIKKRGLIPTSQTTFQDVDLLRFANEELQMQIVPMLMSIREEFFVESTDQALVAAQANYNIPTRAIGRKLKELLYLDAGGMVRMVPRLDHEDYAELGFQLEMSEPQMYYLQADDIYIVPQPASSPVGSLRFFYFQRPNDLVTVAETAKIASFDLVAKTVIVNAVPSTFATSTLCDIVAGVPGFRNRSIDNAITNITSTTLTLTTMPSNLQVGDYLCLSGQSPLPQIPVELHPILAERVVVKVLQALNDAQGAQMAQMKLQEMEPKVLGLLTERVEGSPRKISSNRNIMSHFSRGF